MGRKRTACHRGCASKLEVVSFLCWLGFLSCREAVGDGLDLKVAEAIRNGVHYLKCSQQSSGAWSGWGGSHELGETCLAGLALLAAGTPADGPAVQAAARLVRGQAAGDSDTYDVSLAIMFLDRLGSAADEPLVQSLAANLEGGQCSDGSWSYAVPVAGAGGYGRSGGGGDNSNTQFAALATWVARRHGRQNDRAIQALDGHFRTTFNQGDGGWGYGGISPATPAMTCAGLVALATFRGAEQQRLERSGVAKTGTPARENPGRQPRPAADDPVARAALMALGGVLKQADQVPGADVNRDLYFLWSLERVGVIYDLDKIGGVDWYDWGVRRLLALQGPDGQWQGKGKWEYRGAVGTSFAILFLSRANVAEDLTAEVGAGEAPLAGTQQRSVGVPAGAGGGSQAIGRVKPSPAERPVASPSPSRASPPAPAPLDPR